MEGNLWWDSHLFSIEVSYYNRLCWWLSVVVIAKSHKDSEKFKWIQRWYAQMHHHLTEFLKGYSGNTKSLIQFALNWNCIINVILLKSPLRLRRALENWNVERRCAKPRTRTQWFSRSHASRQILRMYIPHIVLCGSVGWKKGTASKHSDGSGPSNASPFSSGIFQIPSCCEVCF